MKLLKETAFEIVAMMGVALLSLMLILLGWALILGDVDCAAIAFCVALFDGLLLYLYIRHLA